MLRRCLASIAAAAPPESLRVSVLVVENDEIARSREVVDGFADTLAIRHVLEPRPGIPAARNRAVEEALAEDPDWIAFVDDDEFVDPDWLRAYERAMADYPDAVLTGPRRRVYPADTPFWLPPELGVYGYPDRARIETTYTANTFAPAAVFRSDGHGLRFDEAFQFTGGSDSDLFGRYTAAGGTIVWVADAIVSEDVPAARLSFGWNFTRYARLANNRAFQVLKQAGRGAQMRHGLAGSAKALALVVPRAGLAVATLPFDRRKGGRRAFYAFMEIASAYGYLAGLAGRRLTPYRKLEGD